MEFKVGENFTYILKTIDPVHIGTGGYHLSHIDNVIVRNYDSTPKIPASTLSGVARHYLAKEIGSKCAGKDSKCESGSCQVCKTFGFAKDNESRKGAVQFSDALLLFFPISTLLGPVWITTLERLKDFQAGLTNREVKIDENINTTESVLIPETIEDYCYYVIKRKVDFLDINGIIYEKINDTKSSEIKIPADFNRPLVVISEKCFIQAVKRNLEVRTSVSIDPETGTAEEGALFTYEAIPRNSYFYLQLVISPPSVLKNSNDITYYKNSVEDGMKYYRIMGIGGMSTRGFGRVDWQNIVNNGGEKDESF